MKHKPLPTQERLHELFCCVGGKLIRKQNMRGTARRGDKAGRPVGKRRDLMVRVDGGEYMVTRLMWVWYYGTGPGVYEVDHVNDDPHDNNIWNLQLLTSRENNDKGWRDATGVRETRYGKFIARCYVGGSRRYLGTFETRAEAETAYQLARAKDE